MTPIHSPLVTTDPVRVSGNRCKMDVLRLDKIHPVISGNKWFKLRYYLEQAINEKKKTICTFGGAWSNHIVATAAACQSAGLKSIGIIRGEKPLQQSSTLIQAAEFGMELHFVSREDFRSKKIPLNIPVQDTLFVPEGGFGITGAAGAATISELTGFENYTDICCACGTGTMLAGIARSATIHTRITGISVLKNHTGLEKDIQSLLEGHPANFSVLHDYHQGGYAKKTNALIDFMNQFYTTNQIPSDFVYTGKLFFAADDLLMKGYFKAESRVLLIHSGGLQGNESLKKGTLIF